MVGVSTEQLNELFSHVAHKLCGIADILRVKKSKSKIKQAPDQTANSPDFSVRECDLPLRTISFLNQLMTNTLRFVL